METAICLMACLFIRATAFSAVGRTSTDPASFIRGIQVQTTHLHPQQQEETAAPALMPLSTIKKNQVFALTCCGSITDLPPSTNFLATQVWPSARVAAMAMERYLGTNLTTPAVAPSSTLVVCEFGCGPGLPSLAATQAGAAKVYATDIDETALALVREAARRQDLSQRLETCRFDLIHSYMDEIPHADIYLFSDVFENSQVAEGAARVAAELLLRGRSKVWVFAQSDRSQRDVFLRHLRELVGDESLGWTKTDARKSFAADEDDGSPLEPPWQHFGSLWLCEIDETTVLYG
jgi:SAM-dependent methyltransferase